MSAIFGAWLSLGCLLGLIGVAFDPLAGVALLIGATMIGLARDALSRGGSERTEREHGTEAER
jgi:hypothetical protein